MSPKKAAVVQAELAKALEAEPSIREMVRSRGTLVGWPRKETIGIPSLNALSMNSRVLSILADTYCSERKVVKAPPISWLRSEYVKFQSLMSMPTSMVTRHLDTWGLKKLFSLGIRRWGVELGSRRVP